MRKKIVKISIIALVFLLLFTVVLFAKGACYFISFNPYSDYFGDEYRELLVPISFADRKQASNIMETIEESFSFFGTNEEAKSKFGELSKYCVTSKDAESESHSLKLITADLNSSKGYLWFVYSQEWFDKESGLVMGVGTSLVRATLEKHDGEWMVVSVKEHP